MASSGTGWEELFWLVFERSTNPIAVLDDERRFLHVNDATLELFGRSRGEMIGTPISENVWKKFRHGGQQQLARTFVKPDGTEFRTNLAARIVNIGNKRVAVYVVLPQGLSWTAAPARKPHQTALTEREREVVAFVALGLGTDELADELHVSTHTVRTHIRNAMAKLEVHSRVELVAVALCDEKLIDLLLLR
jgi:PAS domain S-box-containing protein